MKMHVKVQTVLGDWATSDPDEFDQQALDSVKDLLREVFASRAGHVSVDNGETTTLVPLHSIARVVIEPAEDA